MTCCQSCGLLAESLIDQRCERCHRVHRFIHTGDFGVLGATRRLEIVELVSAPSPDRATILPLPLAPEPMVLRMLAHVCRRVRAVAMRRRTRAHAVPLRGVPVVRPATRYAVYCDRNLDRHCTRGA